MLAGTVHAAKGTVRPAVTATTAGTGNWLVSIIEDIIALFVSILSILIPILLSVVLIGVILAIILLYLRRRSKNYVYRP
jgi:hypothetical protein